MPERELSQADRDVMESRGWDPDNSALSSQYLDLREKVDASRISENDLNYEMNKADNQELVKENAVPAEKENAGPSESAAEARIRELAERYAAEDQSKDQNALTYDREREQER